MFEYDKNDDFNNSIIRKIDIQSGQLFLNRLSSTVLSIILLYIPIFWFANARLTSVCLAIAVSLIFPCLKLLQKQNRTHRAKILLLSSSNFLVLIASITTNHKIHVEYYCLATMLLGFILFEQDSILWTILGFLEALFVWILLSFHSELLPISLKISPVLLFEALEKTNFLGSFGISAVFLTLFAKHTRDKRLKTLNIEKNNHLEIQRALISKMKAEFQYKKLFEAMQEGVIVYDKNKNIVQCNQSARNILGLSPDEVESNAVERTIFGADFQEYLTVSGEIHPLDMTLQHRQAYSNNMLKISNNSGAIRWISVHSRPYLCTRINSEDLDEMHALVTISDVTDKKATQIELEEFFNVSPDMICVLDMDGNLRQTNPSFYRILEMTKMEQIETPWLDWVDGKDRDRVVNALKGLNENSPYIKLDFKMVTRSGDRRSLEWVFRISVDTQCIYASARDKTDELRAQENFKQIVSALNTTSIVTSFDRSGRIIEANDAFCEISGYKRNEIIGQTFQNLNDISMSELAEKSLKVRIKRGESWTGEIAAKNREGEAYWLQALVFPLKTRTGHEASYMSISFDVSLSKMREKEREELRQQLEEAQKVARIGSWSLDLKSGHINWSKQMFDLFEKQPTEKMPTFDDFLEDIHGDDRALLMTKLNESSQTGARYKVRFRSNSSKKTIWLEAIGQGYYNESGMLCGLSGTCQDVSEKVESEERLSSILDALHIGVWTFDPDTKRLEWDDRMHHLYGIDVDPEIGLFESRQRSLNATSKAESKMAIHLASAGKRDFETLLQVFDRNGQQRYIAEQGIASFNHENNQARLTGISWDRTKEIQMDQSLAEQRARAMNASKMASLGEMSAGIAHEINNPLAIIVFKVQKIHRNIVNETVEREKTLQDLQDIKDTAMRISTIVKGLKTFSRNSDSDPLVEVTASSVVEDSLVLCKERFKNGNVELIVGEIPNLSFMGRAPQISQILINILNNAFDAIREKENPWIRIEVKKSESHQIQFIIIDSGFGIGTEAVGKIMEPFFTTKALGLGTGLGLSISLAMAKDHGGTVYLDQTAKNTTFVLELPLLRMEEEENGHQTKAMSHM